MQGARCDPVDLDRLFRLLTTRRLNTHGCVRSRDCRFLGGCGPAGVQVAVWVRDETVTIKYGAEILAQEPVAFEDDGRRIRNVGEPRLAATDHVSPQPFFPPLDEEE